MPIYARKRTTCTHSMSGITEPLAELSLHSHIATHIMLSSFTLSKKSIINNYDHAFRLSW